jgi:hypothetical protein
VSQSKEFPALHILQIIRDFVAEQSFEQQPERHPHGKARPALQKQRSDLRVKLYAFFCHSVTF